MLKHLLRVVMGRRLPTHAGDVRLAGPEATIRIRRDRWGVPYIDADNDHDAWFGLGFCHGQDGLAGDVAAFAPLMGLGGGSNAWALAPRKTASGRPLIANDPHLLPSAPAQWYLASLRTPTWAAAGATFAGAASISVGHNGDAAWAVTAAHIDVADFFAEEVGPDGASVRHGDAFVPCRVRREEIQVKGREPVIEERGDALPLHWSEERIAEATVHTLTLTPDRP